MRANTNKCSSRFEGKPDSTQAGSKANIIAQAGKHMGKHTNELETNHAEQSRILLVGPFEKGRWMGRQADESINGPTEGTKGC